MCPRVDIQPKDSVPAGSDPDIVVCCVLTQKFQSPVRGDVIMKDLKLKPGPTVGKIKSAIENAILDGIIPNEYEPAHEYMMSIKDEILSSK